MVLHGPAGVLEFPNVFEAGDFPEPLIPKRFRGCPQNVRIVDPVEFRHHFVRDGKFREFGMLREFRPPFFLVSVPVFPAFEKLVPEPRNEFEAGFAVTELLRHVSPPFDSTELFFGKLFFLDHGLYPHPDGLRILQDIACHMEPVKGPFRLWKKFRGHPIHGIGHIERDFLYGEPRVIRDPCGKDFDYWFCLRSGKAGYDGIDFRIPDDRIHVPADIQLVDRQAFPYVFRTDEAPFRDAFVRGPVVTITVPPRNPGIFQGPVDGGLLLPAFRVIRRDAQEDSGKGRRRNTVQVGKFFRRDVPEF